MPDFRMDLELSTRDDRRPAEGEFRVQVARAIESARLATTPAATATHLVLGADGALDVQEDIQRAPPDVDPMVMLYDRRAP